MNKKTLKKFKKIVKAPFLKKNFKSFLDINDCLC